jgi:hypothetical protein
VAALSEALDEGTNCGSVAALEGQDCRCLLFAHHTEANL